MSDIKPLKKNIVTIGGGTGTFVVLSGLKKVPDVSLTAIVSVADSGGATGRLRDAYGSLPLGDARQALIALSGDNGDSLMRKLFAYRFEKGDVTGHNFGNLFLTALTDMLNSDAAAIKAASKILRVRGRVVPVSETPATLIAELESGEAVIGEHEIDERIATRSPIKNLRTKDDVSVCSDALEAIAGADLIVLGPGDLYTSTLANFVVKGLPEAVASSKAKLVYVMNLFTKAGQTGGYGAQKHVDEIHRYINRVPDMVLVHSGEISEEALARYAAEEEFPVVDDLSSVEVIRGEFADVTIVEKSSADSVPRSLIRHSSDKLASALSKLL
jgi:uncharacterized cofD-like protein